MAIISIILQVLLGFSFLMAGYGKVTGSKMHVQNFNHWKLPQWFRVVTGIVQLAGALALFIGILAHSWAAVGALIIGITAIGGILTHLRVKDSFKQTSTILFLGILAFIVFFINFSHLSNFPGF